MLRVASLAWTQFACSKKPLAKVGIYSVGNILVPSPQGDYRTVKVIDLRTQYHWMSVIDFGNITGLLQFKDPMLLNCGGSWYYNNQLLLQQSPM